MSPPTHLHSRKETELSGREGYIEHVCQEIWRELHLALFSFHAQNNLQKSKFCTARYCVQPLLKCPAESNFAIPTKIAGVSVDTTYKCL